MPDGSEQYQWQQSRRRADAVGFNYPIRGLGPEGKYTLWLPSPNAEDSSIIENGQLVERSTVSYLANAELRAAHENALRSLQSDGRIVTARKGFIDFAIAMIRANYNVTDEDLTFLLLQSKAWHADMIDLLLKPAGGPSAFLNMPLPAVSEKPQPPSVPPQKGKSGFLRIFRRE